MSAISIKSISGITSITTPAGVDNQFTLHNNNTTEAVKLDTAGNFHFHNHLNITGISTAANFKTGTSNLHSTGLNIFDLDVDGQTNLDHVSVAGITTFNNNVHLLDNDYIRFGSSQDLSIFHDGTNNWFWSGGGHPTIHESSGSWTLRSVANQNYIIATENNSVDLYYSGTKRFETTSTGASVTGNFGASGNISLSGSFIMPDSLLHANDNTTRIRFPAPSTFSVDTAGSERLRIDSGGRLQIGASNNTGSNTKFVVGFGNNINTTAIINTGDVDTNALTLSNWDGSTTTNKVMIAFDNSGNGGFDIGMPAGSADFAFQASGGERLRITSGGNVGVNVTDPDQKLEVDGIIKGSSYFQAGASGTASNNWHFGAEGNGEFRIYSGNYGAGNEKVRITSAGVIETYGGSGAVAVRIKNGGDAEFYAANNSSKVTLHCDTNLQLTIGDKLRFANTSGGILRSNGQHALKPTGACIQTKVTYRGTKFTNSSGSYQVVHSHDFNGIEAGNRIAMHLDCDMNADNAGSSWQMMGLRIGSTMYSEKIIEHSAGMNMNASANGLTGAMSAGNHAVQFITRNGGGQCSYNEGNTATGIVLHTYEYVS